MKQQNTNFDWSKYRWLAILLAVLFPQLLIPLLIGWGIVALKKKVDSIPGRTVMVQRKGVKPGTEAKPIEECPNGPVCTHEDKGEHHVSTGREVDPWDRPDVDIRKYQRRN